ncbi:MAG: metallophosphoesterase [Verrucomicrobia bacterium]|nr:metallophosphoesterase [Verrucomicrobiota bacterium]
MKSSAAAVGGLALAPPGARAAAGRNFSFVLLGDLHFDRPEHHDWAWMKKEKPDDVRQSENYSRITRDLTPRLFATVRETIADLNRSEATRVAFVLQVGDLVEGLCGSEELATKQNREALDFVRDAKLGAPFLFTKGNHDVTGPGAPEAFGKVFHPFLTEQARQVSSATGELTSARYTVECGGAQFVFFDAYDKESLEWFESDVAKRSAAHLFSVIHPPVVPYGARATWNLYSSAKDRTRREKLLGLLAGQRAFVLGGHIHKFSSLVRTAGRGRFAQLAISSIINAPEVKPKDTLSGVGEYTGDQIRVEPNHSPATEKERRAVYAAERPFVKAFEYADLPGYAVVTVSGANVTARIYSGVSRELWRTVDLRKLLMLPA